MRDEYDFENMEWQPNPYAEKLKKQITIRMGVDVIGYFKAMAKHTGMPYQRLINLYLRDCMDRRRQLVVTWEDGVGSGKS
jgi:uncharacterized protein (DUF4415 family)